MNKELLNEIIARINNFNKDYNFDLEIMEMLLGENKDMFGISGSLYKLTQEQGNMLKYLFYDLGIHYSMNRGGIIDNPDKSPTYWIFIIDNKGNKHE